MPWGGGLSQFKMFGVWSDTQGRAGQRGPDPVRVYEPTSWRKNIRRMGWGTQVHEVFNTPNPWHGLGRSRSNCAIASAQDAPGCSKAVRLEVS